MRQRRHGGLDFADLRDETGRIQLIVPTAVGRRRGVPAFSDLDLGDWIGVEGTVDRPPSTGELSVRVERFELLSKSLRPLPDMRHGLTDPETRYRQRYLDLIVDEDSRRVFRIRPAVIAATRQALVERGLPARSRRRCCSARPAAPRRSRSSPTTTRSTST